MKSRAQADAKQLVPEAVVDALDVQDVQEHAQVVAAAAIINVREIVMDVRDHAQVNALAAAEHVIKKYRHVLERVRVIVQVAPDNVVDVPDRAMVARDVHHVVEHAQDV